MPSLTDRSVHALQVHKSFMNEVPVSDDEESENTVESQTSDVDWSDQDDNSPNKIPTPKSGMALCLIILTYITGELSTCSDVLFARQGLTKSTK